MKTATRVRNVRGMVRVGGLCALGGAGVLAGAVGASWLSPTQPEQEMGQMPPEMEAWMKAATPNEHHEWLGHAVGEWKTTSWFKMDPAMPREHADGRAEVESILGGRYTVMHYDSEVMGMPFSGVGLAGYDNIKGKYVSVWIDSMGTSPMVSYGTREGNTLTFEGSYENPMGEMETMHIESTVHNDDRIVDKFYQVVEGKRVQTGQIEYARVGGGGHDRGAMQGSE